jgi:hypothetical protein
MNRKRSLGLAAVVLLLGACGSDGPEPSGAGELTVSYYQGGPTAGALLLTITGGPVESITASTSQQVAFESPTPGTTRVVVTGDLATGALLRVRVPDVSKSTSYRVQVDQVADRVTFSLIDPAGHTLTIAR